MDGTEIFHIIEVLFGGITGICVPALLFMAKRNIELMKSQNDDRQKRFDDMHKAIAHLDDCVDNVRGLMLARSVTRDDFLGYRSETAESLSRMRAAITTDISQVHDRLMRLEDIYFKRGQADD